MKEGLPTRSRSKLQQDIVAKVICTNSGIWCPKGYAVWGSSTIVGANVSHQSTMHPSCLLPVMTSIAHWLPLVMPLDLLYLFDVGMVPLDLLRKKVSTLHLFRGRKSQPYSVTLTPMPLDFFLCQISQRFTLLGVESPVCLAIVSSWYGHIPLFGNLSVTIFICQVRQSHWLDTRCIQSRWVSAYPDSI